jgi:hypothetical protein
MHNRALATFQCDSHRALVGAFVKLLQPAVKGFWGGGHRSGLYRAFANLRRESVFSLAPVQSHQSRIVFGVHCIFGMAGPGCRLYCVRRG